ncbi:MAG TPA: Nif3-like dinuclear metal center hexameric protein, partial [Gaiellaceae bacterium]|nr:Nif3-like dinuclear metal center hexameric protein [Gaiellaceae bacterium]
MKLDEVVGELDGYFRVAEVENDDWSPAFEAVYGEPYWRQYVEPGYEGKWNGLMVRGEGEVERVATCVFPSDRIVAGLEPGTLLFSEHPLDFADEPGFLPLSRESFQSLKQRSCGFFHAHAPLDMHPEVSPSRLCAAGVGLEALEEYYPIADGIPGGAAIIGDSGLSLEGLAEAFRVFLGPEIKVHVISRPRSQAGRVAVAAGGGADAEILQASIERGCETYVTGNAATNCRIDWVQEKVRVFRELAEEADIAVIDAMHYGMEKPPQLAMVSWFLRLGLPAEFVPDGP